MRVYVPDDLCPATLQAFIQTHRAATRVVQLAGRVTVLYTGRAASLSQDGEFLMLLKADGSLQLHGPRLVKPTNWQPRTDALHLECTEAGLRLTAIRYRPDELLEITWSAVHHATAFEMEEATVWLEGTEAQLRARLAANPSVIEPGLTILEEELPVGVGGVDLYALDREGRYVIIELKRGKATQEAVHQLRRYVDQVQAQLDRPVRGILAAPSITRPARRALETAGLEYAEIQALPTEPEPDPQPPLF